ncbi:MAG: hypothetical protein ABW352_12980 [Polyangiales bacterium]
MKRLQCAVALGVLFVIACSDGEDPARPGAILTDQDTQNIISAADIESMNGTYTNCTNRTDPWSLAVTGTPTLDNAPLSVIRGDTGCQLAITEIRTGADGLLEASAPIALSTTFGPARSFGNPISFYATAAVGSVNFGGDFSLTLLFSAQPRNADDMLTASFATVTNSSASAVGVPAPNYTLNAAGATVTTDIAGIVITVLGNVGLTAGSAPGDSYLIVSGSVNDSYADINSTFLAGSPTAVSATIAASAFLAPGVNLASGAVRTLIIAKITNGVASYQKLAITFNPPS